MKNKKAGFIIPLLITIVALLAVGGGAYFYVNKDLNYKVIKQDQNTVATTSDSFVNIQANSSKLTSQDNVGGRGYGNDDPDIDQKTYQIKISPDPISQRGDGKFWGNDSIGFTWSSNYTTIAARVNLYNSSNQSFFQKELPPGSMSSSAKFGESIGVNQNWPTGTYRISICDDLNKNKIASICASTNYFTITATTTPFQP